MASTVRYWDGAAWTDHVAPASSGAVDGPARPCPYCRSSISAEAARCSQCAGDLLWCKRCNARVGVVDKQKFVGLARGGTKTRRSCMTCNAILDGPRW